MAEALMSAAGFRYTAKLANEIEERWQALWEEEGTFFQTNPGDEEFDAHKPRFYCLDMFPYPSGAGLHVGHPEGYTATDIVSRYKRMSGFNVLHPMGWDAYGLPAEQYAIETGIHPAETTRQSIDTFRRQLKRFGFSYDWSREFGTIDPDYYRWTQWIFLKIYHSWFDRTANRARPIAELIEELERGHLGVGPEYRIVDRRGVEDLDGLVGSLSTETALPSREWSDLSEEEQRDFIDVHRLAYVDEQTVNWCPKLGTVLSNEEVIDGRSERGGHPVLRKPLRQWLFRITRYAERLLGGLEHVDWPESTKTMQAEWIGKSRGADIDFELPEPPPEAPPFLRVYTTRPDTTFGATYMVVAPEHPLVDAILANPAPGTDREALSAYAEQARNRSDLERQENKEKTGVDTGVQAINPCTGKPIPIWTADYVLPGYGHGAIMAVPAHDERDFEFATKFGIEILEVVKAPEGEEVEGCYAGEGTNVNSANDEVSIDGLETPDAKARIIAWFEEKGVGRGKVNYRLRDWLFSRQRYWGEPFPIVWDERGRHHAVGYDRLPVELPPLADYHPVESEDPQPLLAKATDWIATTAGEAGVGGLDPDAPVERETDTMPGWAGSCWYFLRFCDPKNQDRFAAREAERYWLSPKEGDVAGGVDLYIGGAEHAVLHLLYARFWHMVLYDLGEVSSPEPFRRLFHQGMITSYAYQRPDKSLVPITEVDEVGEDKYVERDTGEAVTQVVAKMSKSLKNVINPDDVIENYGADTFRLYEMYMGALADTKPWNTRDIAGLYRFLQRVWRLAVDEQTGELKPFADADEQVEKLLHRTIAKVGSDIDKLAFNTAIAAMIEWVNAASGTGISRDQLDRFVRTLAPFAPHLGEELWSKLGNDGCVSLAEWPRFDESMLVDDTIEIPVQILGKVRARIEVAAGADEKALEAAALAHERVRALLEGKTVRKVIVIPGRLVNIVAN
jgi:leucyl-tRNA synthetase